MHVAALSALLTVSCGRQCWPSTWSRDPRNYAMRHVRLMWVYSVPQSCQGLPCAEGCVCSSVGVYLTEDKGSLWAEPHKFNEGKCAGS